MNVQICDYWSEKNPKHRIKLTNTPNGEIIKAELCDKCFNDIVKAKS